MNKAHVALLNFRTKDIILNLEARQMHYSCGEDISQVLWIKQTLQNKTLLNYPDVNIGDGHT